MVILNGKQVKEDIIDPSRHKFIGLFRESQPPGVPKDCNVVMCACGRSLWDYESIRTHWINGCMDIPQYIDIMPCVELPNGGC